MVDNRIYGVGVNDANYCVKKMDEYKDEYGNRKSKQVWVCPYYLKWKDMLKRCYSEKFILTSPTYKYCTVCEEWLIFSNFKAWMEKQDWEGKQLDKDLIDPRSKIYSPDTCYFIPRRVNTFIILHKTRKNKYPLGVYKKIDQPRTKPFSAEIRSVDFEGTNKVRRLGHFSSPMEAHKVWQEEKINQSKLLQDFYKTDAVIYKGLQQLINKIREDMSNNRETTGW